MTAIEPAPDGGARLDPDGQPGVDPRARLVSAVDVVRGRLAAATLPLEGAGVETARRRRRELLDQIDDYLLPRLRTDGAPLLVVVGGSTGAGKSTLVNSLLGAPLTRPGVLRPTTRSPVLVHHPSDGPWFVPDRILPTLPRVSVDAAGSTAPPADAARGGATTQAAVRALRLAPFDGMPPGLALLDAPDVDSVETANRDLAAQLLAAADLWLFVTTAARYADAVPWDLLRSAASRRAQVALVIDRVDRGSEEVVADLARMARENALGDAPLFVVPESELDDEGMLPASAVAEIAGWLTDLGGDAAARTAVAEATRDGVLDDLVGSVRDVADAADAQAEAARRLTAIVANAYEDAARRISVATSDGALLRGEVLARWQDFVGASDVMRAIERGVGKVRDAVGAFFRGGRASAQPVELAIAHGLEAVTLDALETARERVRSAWRADPAGAALLVDASATAGVTGIGTTQLRAAIAEQVRGWQEDVLAVVREQGEDRRGLARALSFGVNGLGVALMLTAFSVTGGITGAEVGIAGGTAVLAQKVLEAAFGDDAVRRLTADVQARLQARLASIVSADATIALTAVTAAGVSEADGEALRRAAAEVAEATRAAAAATPATADRTSAGSAGAVGVASRAGTGPAVGATADSFRPPGPMLRGAELRGRIGLAAVSPYGATGAGHRVGGGDAVGSDGEGASSGATGGQPRPGFWRRLFGRGER